jgi:hypothetical protein
MPERMEMELAAEASSESTGGKRQVWKNKEFGVTLVVTWMPPRIDIGLQSFSCKALPHWTFDNYEALRKTYADKVLSK